MATRRIRNRPSSPRKVSGSRDAEKSTAAEVLPQEQTEPGDGGNHGQALPLLEIGRCVGRYRLCGEVASGGMATVHVALLEGAAGFEKVVALKAIHPHLAKKKSFVQMFLDEARIASRLEHPNVCHVFDFGQADGGYYLAMEYLTGVTLSRFVQTCRARGLDRKPRFTGAVARIIADAAEGLHAAHELTDAHGRSLQIVHRDVSPQNIFLTYSGVTKVVDFGIAHAKNKLHQTHTGEVKGNFPYVAPEQIAGRDVTRQADIWSLGVITWELLAGRSLFERETSVQTMFAVTTEPVPPLRKVRPSVPEGLEHVVQKALERTPAGRYDSSRRFGGELLSATPEPLSSGELSEIMETLFPGEQASARSFVSRAMELQPVRSRRWVKPAAAAIAVAGAAALAIVTLARSTVDPTQSITPHPSENVASPVSATNTGGEEREAAPATDRVESPSLAKTRVQGRSPASRPGQLNLVTPGASSEVLYRGRPIGWTPLSKRLAPGSYVLTVRPPGGTARRVRVRIRPNRTTRRTLTVR